MSTYDTRSDTTLIGSCDGQWCWGLLSSEYPPTSDSLYLLSHNGMDNSLFGMKLGDCEPMRLRYPDGTYPACIRPQLETWSIQDHKATVTASIRAYSAPDTTQAGWISSCWSGTVPEQRQVTMSCSIPCAYPTHAILASVPYQLNGQIETVTGDGYCGHSSCVQQPFLFFVTCMSVLQGTGTMASADQLWLEQYAQSQVRVYRFPSQLESLVSIIGGNPANPNLNAFTSRQDYDNLRSYGMVFYSWTHCGQEVEFVGIDDTSQHGMQSFGPCEVGYCNLTCCKQEEEEEEVVVVITRQVDAWYLWLYVIMTILIILIVIAIVCALVLLYNDEDEED